MNDSDRPYVWLPLKHRLHDVLTHDCRRLKDGWLLNGDRLLCRFILDRLEPTLFPPECPPGADVLKLYVPVGDMLRHVVQKNWLCLSPLHRAQVQQEVEVQLRLRAWQWDVEGRSMGYTEKQIVWGFLEAYGLRQSADGYEMVKKMMYRQRRQVRQEIAMSIGSYIARHDVRRTLRPPSERRVELELF